MRLFSKYIIYKKWIYFILLDIKYFKKKQKMKALFCLGVGMLVS